MATIIWARALDEIEITYAPSARVLRAARAALGHRSDQPRILAGAGNPLPHPRPLHYAQAELEEIATLFAAEARRPLYGEAATREALGRVLLGATHVHLCCHGKFDPARPLESRLDLADGPWTLREILDEQPFERTRLVTLSACQTAMVEFERLPDEVIGLPAGCLQAGAPGVLATLWPVDDLSTALIMARFYRDHLVGDPATGEGPMTPAAALRRAQCWLRDVTVGELVDLCRQRRAVLRHTGSAARELAPHLLVRLHGRPRHERPFAEPYFWAPFAFFGV